MESNCYLLREYLLQLREKLRISSLEVEASRNAIERETKADAEQILARLRTMESHKQSTIQQEVLDLTVLPCLDPLLH